MEYEQKYKRTKIALEYIWRYVLPPMQPEAVMKISKYLQRLANGETEKDAEKEGGSLDRLYEQYNKDSTLPDF